MVQPEGKITVQFDSRFIDVVENRLVGYFMLKLEAEKYQLPPNTRFEDFNPYGLEVGRMRSGSKLSGSQAFDIEWRSQDSGSVVKTHLEIPAVTQLRIEEDARKPRSYSESLVAHSPRSVSAPRLHAPLLP